MIAGVATFEVTLETLHERVHTTARLRGLMLQQNRVFTGRGRHEVECWATPLQLFRVWAASNSVGGDVENPDAKVTRSQWGGVRIGSLFTLNRDYVELESALWNEGVLCVSTIVD